MIDEDDCEWMELYYEGVEQRQRSSRHGMTEDEAEEDAVMTATEAYEVNKLLRY